VTSKGSTIQQADQQAAEIGAQERAGPHLHFLLHCLLLLLLRFRQLLRRTAKLLFGDYVRLSVWANSLRLLKAYRPTLVVQGQECVHAQSSVACMRAPAFDDAAQHSRVSLGHQHRISRRRCATVPRALAGRQAEVGNREWRPVRLPPDPQTWQGPAGY
jgi:hypothetical protein